MKNKILFLFLLISISCSFLFAQISNLKVNISPEFGFLNGTITENVWNSNMIVKNNKITYEPTTKLSQLDWQLDNTPYAGLDAKFLINEKFLFDLNILAAIPGDCGIMEDFDWKTISMPQHLTNYSKHTNQLISLSQIKCNFGYNFIPQTKIPIYVTSKIGINFFSFDFAGTGGFRSYESESWQIHNYADSVIIEYMQKYFAPRLSLYTRLNADEAIEVESGFGFSYVYKFDAFDFHEIKHKYYNDKIQNAYILDFDLKIIKRINDYNKFGFKWSLFSMMDSFGLTYISSTTKNFPSNPDSATLGGTNSFIWYYSIFYTLSF